MKAGGGETVARSGRVDNFGRKAWQGVRPSAVSTWAPSAPSVVTSAATSPASGRWSAASTKARDFALQKTRSKPLIASSRTAAYSGQSARSMSSEAVAPRSSRSVNHASAEGEVAD